MDNNSNNKINKNKRKNTDNNCSEKKKRKTYINSNNNDIIKKKKNGFNKNKNKNKNKLIFGNLLTKINNNDRDIDSNKIIGNPNIDRILKEIKIFKDYNFIYHDNDNISDDDNNENLNNKPTKHDLQIKTNYMFYGPTGNGMNSMIKKFCLNNDIPLIVINNFDVHNHTKFNIDNIEIFFKQVNNILEEESMIIILFSNCQNIFKQPMSEKDYDKQKFPITHLIEKLNYNDKNGIPIISFNVIYSPGKEIMPNLIDFYVIDGTRYYKGQPTVENYREIYQKILINLGIINLEFMNNINFQNIMMKYSLHCTFKEIKDYINKVINKKIYTIENSGLLDNKFKRSKLILEESDFSTNLFNNRNIYKITSYDSTHKNFNIFKD